MINGKKSVKIWVGKHKALWIRIVDHEKGMVIAMTIEEMKQIKKAKGYTYAQIAKWSGVPLGTVQKIFCGETESPRYSTLQALEELFLADTIDLPNHHKTSCNSKPVVREEPAYCAFRQQGEYTVEDYYAMPDEKRVELIDGVIYNMSSPTFVHQRIAGEIHRQIADYIAANKGSCIPIIAPMDVRLDCDNKTMVQPDVIVICDKTKIKSWGIMGAPDFVLEVLSPSTKRKDCIKKLDKYMEAGVREYWMIDPEHQKLVVYRFEEEIYPIVYGLDEKIGLGIWQGQPQIDLRTVKEMIQDYPDDGKEE